MGAVSYKIKAFDPEEAASGALCIVTSTSVDEDSSITPDATWNELVEGQTEPIKHKTVVGTGICRRSGNQFVITIGSTNYLFKTDGSGYSVNAKDKYIYLCEVSDNTQVVGSTAIINEYVVVDGNNRLTRSPIADGANRGYNIHELNARDEFAAQALRGILARIDNPSVLSENEIQFYCDAAYKWADKMILETAKRRVLGDENIPTGTTGGSESSTTINQTYTVSEQELKNIADNIKNLNISVEAGDTTVDIDTDGLIKALTGKDNKASVDDGDDVASKLDNIVRGLIGKDVNNGNIAEYNSLLESLENISKGVPLKNTVTEDWDDIPLKVQMENGTVAIENVVEQGTSNPFIVASTVTNAKGSNNRTIPLAVSASIDSIDMPGGDASSPMYVNADSIPWVFLSKHERAQGAGTIEIPYLKHYQFVKLEWYNEEGELQGNTDVLYAAYKVTGGNLNGVSDLNNIGYLDFGDIKISSISIAKSGGDFEIGDYIKIYVAGNFIPNSTNVNIKDDSNNTLGTSTHKLQVEVTGGSSAAPVVNNNVPVPSVQNTYNINLNDYVLSANGGTMTGDLIMDDCAIKFNEGAYTYIKEDTDIPYKISMWGNSGIDLSTSSITNYPVTINGYKVLHEGNFSDQGILRKDTNAGHSYGLLLEDLNLGWSGGVGEGSDHTLYNYGINFYSYNATPIGRLGISYDSYQDRNLYWQNKKIHTDGDIQRMIIHDTNDNVYPDSESDYGVIELYGIPLRRADQNNYYLDYLKLSGGTLTGDVRIQNKKLYIIDSNVSSTFSIGDFANDGTVTFKNDANDFKFEGSVYSYNELLTSDITLKDVLSEEEFEVSKLAEMPLVKFTWKDEKKDKKVHFGSIAQEWEKILPEVVSKGSDDKLYLDYNGASMAAGVTACREIVKMKEEMEALKKENEYLKKELEAIKEIVYGKEKDDMED